VNDPLFSDQWHLKNTGQKGTNGVAGTAGEDINVMSVWNTFRGIGIRIAVVDDGVDIHHEDIAGNVPSGAGHNYCSGGTDPTTCNPGNGCNPGGDGCHGTSVAGLAAAASNGVGGLGVAPESSIVGYNLLQNETAVNEADAMTRDIANNQIYTNSWGATDGTGINFPASSTWLSAIDVGTSTGRNNKGAIYTWAAGNGGGGGACGKDNSNYDGQANYHGVFAITALDDTGKQATYSENGANLLIGSYGGEFCYSYQSGHLAHALTTTDMTGSSGANDGGYNSEFNTSDYSNGNYTKCMNGTSGAAPIAAGGIALVLQANPNLTWRDTRIILAQSARKNDPYDADWHTNGAGLHVNHKYGYGVLDVDAAVTKAKTWTNVGATATPFSQTTSPNLAIPDAGSAITSSISVSNSGLTAVEFVDVIVTTNHPSAGDLKITLTSPQGTSSTLSETHACYGLDSSNSCSYSAGPCGCIDGSASCASGAQWSFGVARLINEQPNGNWTLSVQDGISGNTGTLKSWTLTIYGR
jgi:kexin